MLSTSHQGQVAEALEALLSIEKAQRLGEDIGGTRRACMVCMATMHHQCHHISAPDLAAAHSFTRMQAILEVLREAGDWPGLNEHILLLAKRRSQLKQVGAVSCDTSISPALAVRSCRHAEQWNWLLMLVHAGRASVRASGDGLHR